MCFNVHVNYTNDKHRDTLFAIKSKSKRAIASLKEQMKRAKEDIIVYKVMDLDTDGSLYSLIKGFEYHVGYEYYQEGSFDKQFKVTFDGTRGDAAHTLQVSKGLHSYSNIGKARFYLNGITWPWASKEFQIALVRCRIPKGALYIENHKQEYLSNRIIIDKVI